ncbi:MAG: hypothetical protein VKL59_17095 [Nostocaceae cyanobacterium]|nr:hypothetical protein [Nostocaceae cyanobacterium]
MSDTMPPGKVTNPKLTLYAFHLRNNLAQGYDEPVDDANHLWEQCQQLGQKLNIPRLESLIERLQDNNGNIGLAPSKDNPKSDYLELLQKERLLNFSAISDGSTLQLRGEVYPLQIHDTYAVDITLRYPYSDVEVHQLGGLNHQGCLLLDSSNSSLGQTLVLFAQSVGDIQDTQAFAEACLTAILPKPEAEKFLLSPPVKGTFLGSPIFEYENNQDNAAQNGHILIWLNCHPQTETLEEAGDYYQPLINLLCCRHKILYVYSESRWCNHEARILYKQLETQRKRLRKLPSEPAEKLIQLQHLITETIQLAFDYANHLRDLAVHRNTIEANGKNYCFWLKQLQAISIEGEDNLDFWQQLINRIQEKFIEQIGVDLAYLIPAQQLFQQMIDTIRGMVEILAEEQAQVREQQDKERDRNLQTTIAVVGVGIGFTGLAAASFPYLIPPDAKTTPIPLQPPFTSGSLHPFISVLLLSLIFGFLGAGVAKVVTMLISLCSDKRAKLKSSPKNQLLNQANTPEVGQVTGVQQKVEIPTQPPRK